MSKWAGGQTDDRTAEQYRGSCPSRHIVAQLHFAGDEAAHARAAARAPAYARDRRLSNDFPHEDREGRSPGRGALILSREGASSGLCLPFPLSAVENLSWACCREIGNSRGWGEGGAWHKARSWPVPALDSWTRCSVLLSSNPGRHRWGEMHVCVSWWEGVACV